MPDLPIEIWSIIASNAERSDLPRFALVSSLHRDVAQDALVSDLHLGSSPKPDYRKVLSALKEEHVLHRTHHLIIDIVADEPLDVAAVPVEQMPNLRRLILSAPGSLFETAELQKVFVHRLKGSCTKLQSVQIRVTVFDKRLPGKEFSIPNLCSIAWTEGGKLVTYGFHSCYDLIKLANRAYWTGFFFSVFCIIGNNYLLEGICLR